MPPRRFAPFLLIIGALLPLSALSAQETAPEVEILTTALSHARATFMQEKGATDLKLFLDPTALNERGLPGSRDLDEAGQVARMADIPVKPLGELVTCPGECQLDADAVFSLGVPEISGDSATVWVLRRWSAPKHRDPIPFASAKLILARQAGEWVVIGRSAVIRS